MLQPSQLGHQLTNMIGRSLRSQCRDQRIRERKPVAARLRWHNGSGHLAIWPFHIENPPKLIQIEPTICLSLPEYIIDKIKRTYIGIGMARKWVCAQLQK